MRKTINRETIEGRIFDHSLEKKVTGPTSKVPGTTYIGGDIDIATDEDGLNIVTVHYSYVTEKTSKQTSDKTYPVLLDIINNGKTIVKDGKENATSVRCTGVALALNDFYTDNAKSETNPDGLVSAKRNERGFISIVSKLNSDETKRNTFECDMLITGTRLVEADEERGIANDYLVVKGAVFNYKNDILPVEFVVRNSGGMNYFQGLNASNKEPVFTKVWGNINSQTIVKTYQEETAFGEPVVKESSRTVREWVITGAAKEPYEIGDAENGATMEELVKANQDRNIYLADVKRRQDEYKASKTEGSSSTAGITAGADLSFNF